MTIKTHGRMMTNKTIGADQLAVDDYGTDNQALVTDGAGTIRWATVGVGGSVGSSTYVENIFTGNGVLTKFQMTATAAIEESLLVFVDGVAQPTSAFTLTSSGAGIGAGGNLDEINVSPALVTDQKLRVCHLGINTAIADGSITGAKLSFPPAAAGDLLYHNGTQYSRFPIGAAGELFVTNAGATAPEWMSLGTGLQVFRTNAAATSAEWVDATTATLPATGADGNVLTSDGTNWASELPLGGVGGELVSIQTFVAVGAQGNTAGARGTAQTWTRPSGVKRIEVHLVGQGGNSQNDGGSWGGGAAGAGGYCVGIYDVTDTATATVTIPVAWDGTGNFNNLTFPSIFAVAGGTTMTAGAGAGGQNNAAGGTAVGGALNFAGESGSDVGLGGKAHTHFGGVSGHGAKGITTDSGSTGFGGSSGYCYIKEYSDVSASLVGDKLVSTQSFINSGSWTKPANITKIEVWAVGGGGAASGASGNPAGGGGGGGTAYSILDVTNLTTGTVVVGGTSSFAGTGITTLTGSVGGSSASGTSGTGGAASGGNAGNFPGSSGTLVSSGDGGRSGESQFGAYGHGAGPVSSLATGTGTGGIVFIKEYTDPSLISGGFGGVADEEYLAPVANSVTPATGVWTRPAGVTQIEVQLIGAGGGGGRNTLTGGTGYGGKGGEGGLVKRVIDVRSLATIDYFVGTRGLGVASGSANGATGGTVSFGHNGTALSTALTVTVTGGAITAITNPGAAGSGITLAPLIFIEPDVKIVGSAVGGSGATAVATISGGAVTGITVTNGGTGYVQGSVIASFGVNAIGGTGGTTTGGGTTGLAGANGLHFGNKGNFEPWTMGGGSSDLLITYREVGSGGIGVQDIGVAGHGQHGAIYIRSYR
jgi:hypothetical protein